MTRNDTKVRKQPKWLVVILCLLIIGGLGNILFVPKPWGSIGYWGCLALLVAYYIVCEKNWPIEHNLPFQTKWLSLIVAIIALENSFDEMQKVQVPYAQIIMVLGVISAVEIVVLTSMWVDVGNTGK